MVNVWLDGQKLAIDDPCPSWSSLLQSVEACHLGEQRVVQVVRFDGEAVEDFRARPDTTLDTKGRRIDIETVDSSEYLIQLVETAPEHLVQIGKVLADAVECYRQNLLAEGSKRLHSVLIGLDSVMGLLRTADALGSCDLSQLPVGDRTVEQEVVTLGGVLSDVIRHQESEDTARLADVLDRDLAGRLVPMSQVFVSIAAFLRDPESTSTVSNAPDGRP